MKKQYRDQYQMYSDVLQVCKEPQIISGISRKSNLSHWTVRDMLDTLISSEMIRTEESKSDRRCKFQVISTSYITTEKGLKFMEVLDSLKVFLK